MTIHYEGKFKDFQFHGEGTRTKKGKTVTAIFDRGLRSREKLPQSETNNHNQTIEDLQMQRNRSRDEEINENNINQPQENRENQFNRLSRLDH